MFKNNFQKSFILLPVLLLLVVHAMMANRYVKTLQIRAVQQKGTLTVLSDDAYKILSLGNRDFLSVLLPLYAIYHSATYNIPSADYTPLMALLKGSSNLDIRNIQPYYQVIYYWSWAKDDERRKLMAQFMETGIDRFPTNWEIPYSLYRLKKGIDDEKAMTFLQMAASRASIYDGPAWLVDYPSILMSREGETMEAYLWTIETYNKTTNEAHRKTLLEQLQLLEEKLTEEGIEVPKN